MTPKRRRFSRRFHTVDEALEEIASLAKLLEGYTRDVLRKHKNPVHPFRVGQEALGDLVRMWVSLYGVYQAMQEMAHRLPDADEDNSGEALRKEYL